MMYRFPGIKLAKGEQSPFASQIKNDWFLARIADAIGQACHTDPVNRPEMIIHAVTAREAIAACLATADAAIAEACAGLEIPNPLTPEASPERPRRRDR